MASIFQPRRGKKNTLANKHIIPANGEIIFEYPDTGVGTGEGRVKMGDGLREYKDLPYFLSNSADIESKVDKPVTPLSGSLLLDYIINSKSGFGSITALAGVGDSPDSSIEWNIIWIGSKNKINVFACTVDGSTDNDVWSRQISNTVWSTGWQRFLSDKDLKDFIKFDSAKVNPASYKFYTAGNMCYLDAILKVKGDIAEGDILIQVNKSYSPDHQIILHAVSWTTGTNFNIIDSAFDINNNGKLKFYSSSYSNLDTISINACWKL